MTEQAKGNPPGKGKYDKVVEDSFPASDPPASSGIVGPTGTRHPDEKGRPADTSDDAKAKGRPTDDRHAQETAYHHEGETPPRGDPRAGA